MTRGDIEIIATIALIIVIAYLNNKYDWMISHRLSEGMKIMGRYFKKAG